MIRKRFLITLIIWMAIFISVGIFIFPISESQLVNETQSIIESKIDRTISIVEEIKTVGSFLLLVTVDNGELYVVHAEKYIAFNRYRILNPLTVKNLDNTFKTKNLLHDLSITIMNKSLQVNEELNILKHAGLFLLLFFVFPLISVIHSVFKNRKISEDTLKI